MKKKQMQELLRIVMATAPEEIDCDEFLARVGAFLEAMGAADGVSPDLRAVEQHLEVCPECREEFAALVNVYREGT